MKTSDFDYWITRYELEKLKPIAAAFETESSKGGKTIFDHPDRHLTGACGEYGLANTQAFKERGFKFDDTVRGAIGAHNNRLSGDTGGVEVKATTHLNGGLGAPRKKIAEYPPTLKIVLVTVNYHSGGAMTKAVGWAYAKELAALPDNPKFAKYPGPLMEQAELRPMETFFNA